jgi:hypothetical protein
MSPDACCSEGANSPPPEGWREAPGTERLGKRIAFSVRSGVELATTPGQGFIRGRCLISTPNSERKPTVLNHPALRAPLRGRGIKTRNKPAATNPQVSDSPVRFGRHPVIARERSERGNPSPQLVCVDCRAPAAPSLAMTDRGCELNPGDDATRVSHPCNHPALRAPLRGRGITATVRVTTFCFRGTPPREGN